MKGYRGRNWLVIRVAELLEYVVNHRLMEEESCL